jgi:hypothetical protein
MKKQLVCASLTALALAALVLPSAFAEESRFDASRAADRPTADRPTAERSASAPRPNGDAVASLVGKLQGGFIGNQSGCSHIAWSAGQTGVCVLMSCNNGCSALSCTYDSGYQDGYVGLDCLFPGSANIH